MAERQTHRSQAPIWGIFLLILGIVLLLQTFGVLQWGLWGTLWRFWPVLIIILGVSILLRQQSVWLVSLVVFIILVASVGIAVWQHGLPAKGITTSSFTQPLGSLRSADVSIDFSAGRLTIDSLAANSANFVEAQAEERNNVQTMQANFRQQGSNGILSLSTVNQQFRGSNTAVWDTKFTPNLPIALIIKSAAANMNLNLSPLKVADLALDANAGNCVLTMPAAGGITQASIKANAANIEVTIPQGVAARIQATVSVGAVDIDQSRFPKSGSIYQSTNYDSAANRIDLKIDTNVGRVQVK